MGGCAHSSGAGEAIIVDARGRVIEGPYSGLLWWRGETLVRPSESLPRIRSVTVGIVIEAARAQGVKIDDAHARPADLHCCELWVLSAPHGLRTARQWIGGPALGPATHSLQGRAWLENSLVELVPRPGGTLSGG